MSMLPCLNTARSVFAGPRLSEEALAASASVAWSSEKGRKSETDRNQTPVSHVVKQVDLAVEWCFLSEGSTIVLLLRLCVEGFKLIVKSG